MSWVLTIVFMASAGWSFTEVLALTSPHLTPRQRWLVVFWLFSTVGGISIAWQVGA